MERITHVVIIDDDSINNFIITRLVNYIDPAVVVSSYTDGWDGFEFVKNNSRSIHMSVLLDLNIPGVDGWELVEAFDALKTQQHEKLQLFVISCSPSPTDFEKAAEYACVQKYLVKPVGKEDLVLIIQRPQKSTAS